MEGILYLTDAKNNRKFIQIDIEKYGGEYLEHLIHGLIAESRRKEESVSFEDVMTELKADGKLDE